MDAPRLRSNPAAAGPERALRKEVTALADRLKALTAEEERAHAATLARFDDTDDDEDDGAVPPPPPPPPAAPPAPPPPPVETTAAAADVACPALARAVCAYKAACLGAEAAAQPRGGAELKGLVAALHHQGAARVPYDPAAATAAHASARKRPPRPKPPGGSSSRKAPPAPISTSLAGALADGRWDACQKWTFAHAAAPYPSAEEKAALARKAGWPPDRVNHWFSNMRKRKYLKLRDGSRAPRDAFEAQLYHFIRRGADADASP